MWLHENNNSFDMKMFSCGLKISGLLCNLSFEENFFVCLFGIWTRFGWSIILIFHFISQYDLFCVPILVLAFIIYYHCINFLQINLFYLKINLKVEYEILFLTFNHILQLLNIIKLLSSYSAVCPNNFLLKKSIHVTNKD